MREEQHLIRGINQKTNKYDNVLNSKIIHIGRVVDNADPLETMRIKVKIDGLDNSLDLSDVNANNNLWCNFLGYKGQSTVPQIGEAVFVILSDIKKPYSDRFWTGPIIGNVQNFDNEPYITALNNTSGAIVESDKPLTSVKDCDKIYPLTPDEINNAKLIGRENADIQLPKNTARIRTCYYNKNDLDFSLNKKNPNIYQSSIVSDEGLTYQVLMSDMLILLSRAEGSSAKLTGNNHEITDEDVLNVKENGYSLMRAEPTIDLLKSIIKFLCIEHVHSFSGKEPINKIDSAQSLINFDFNTLVNKGVKMN